MRTKMKIMVISRNQFPILLIPGCVDFALLFDSFQVGPMVTPGLVGVGFLSSSLLGVVKVLNVCEPLEAFIPERFDCLMGLGCWVNLEPVMLKVIEILAPVGTCHMFYSHIASK